MRETSHRRPRWALPAVLIIVIYFCTLAGLTWRRDAAVGKALHRLRPGLTQAEVRALLKPLRADMMIKEQNQKEGRYLLRGIDEFIIVVMDGDAEDARVREVQHVPDLGPWWERLRRNWEARFR